MSCKLTIPILAIMLLTPALAPGDQADVEQLDVDQVFDELRTAYDDAETPAAKLEIVRTFLEQFPESRYTTPVLEVVTYLLSEEMDDRDGAIVYAREILGKVEDPEAAGEIRHILADLLADPAHVQELRLLADEMSAAGQTSFSDHLTLIRAATGAEAWDMVREYCATARPQANAKAFAADYPDRDITAEYIQESGRNRQGLLGSYEGWAQAHQGQTDQALRTFTESESLVRFTYLRVPDNDLYIFWGRTLAKSQDYDGALEKLGLAAAWGFSAEAQELMREFYTAKNGNGDGFDEYFLSVRKSSARTMDDFTLPDYQEQKLSLAKLKGKVTLVAFWFPT